MLLKTLFAGSMLFLANMCSHIFVSCLASFWMLYRVEMPCAVPTQNSTPMLSVVLQIGILLGLVQFCIFQVKKIYFFKKFNRFLCVLPMIFCEPHQKKCGKEYLDRLGLVFPAQISWIGKNSPLQLKAKWLLFWKQKWLHLSSLPFMRMFFAPFFKEVSNHLFSDKRIDIYIYIYKLNWQITILQ